MAQAQTKRGNPNWAKGTSGNSAGRPRQLDKYKKTYQQTLPLRTL